MSRQINTDAVSIRTSDRPLPDGEYLEDQITAYVSKQRERYKSSRALAEERWREAWALYIGSPEAMEDMRSQILHTVGDVNVDWRHKINVGKAFEAVETIHGYLMAATFPNRDWFDVQPESPSDMKMAQLVQKFVGKKLEQGNFRTHYENFLRQLIITGNSVLALPWRYETVKWKKRVKRWKPKSPDETTMSLDDTPYEWVEVTEDRIVENHPDFETIDMFDVWFDTSIPDPNRSGLLRRLYKTKAEVIQDMDAGLYIYQPPDTIMGDRAVDSSKAVKDIYMGVSNEGNRGSPADVVEIWEYWGDVHLDDITYKDVVVTVMGDNTLLRFEPNPFWGGRPFIIGSFIPVLQTYSMGAIQPNAGLLHELNIVTNQRLDNLELSIDQMWTVKADGLLQPEDVYTEPGKVFLVADHDDIAPVPGVQGDYPITYQESGVLEQFIDKNFGTGPLIGGGQPRGGERVTAEEIQAVRDAGGNRLSNVHKHIEDTALMPLLARIMRSCQQFVTKDELVRISGGKPDSFEYYTVGPDELNNEWKLKPLGADYVADRKKYIQERLDFLAAVVQIPQMAAKVNYDAILFDLVHHFGFDDPDRYIVDGAPAMAQDGTQMPAGGEATPSQDPNAPPQGGVIPPGAQTDIASQVYDMGGKPLQQAIMNDLQAGGMNTVLQKYLGQQRPNLGA